MKIKILIITSILSTFSFLFFNRNLIEENPIVGNWNMCQDFSGGVLTRRNGCLGISFFENGTGKTTMPSNFNWQVKDSLISFSFGSVNDKNDFISHDSIFTFETFEDEKVKWLKLKNSKSNNWYLLGIDKNKQKRASR